MVVAPAFASMWAAASGRPQIAGVLALSALLFKEDAVFVVLALAASFAWLGHPRIALGTAALAVAWTVLVVGLVMPALRDGIPGDLGVRYEAVTGGRDGIAGLLWLASHPLDVLRVVARPEHLGTVARFISGTAPLVLAVPWTAALLVPGLALAVLSTHPPQAALELHYAAELVAVATLGLLTAVRRLSTSIPASALAAAVLAPAFAGFIMLSPASPLATEDAAAVSNAHRDSVRHALALIPDGASVSAQSGLVARLAHREAVYEFPRGSNEAAWVILDRYGFRSTQSIAAGYDRAVEEVRATHRLVYELDGVLVFADH
jgi:hypothetical protein